MVDLKPDYVVGFTDGEGCFAISIREQTPEQRIKGKGRTQIFALFSVSQSGEENKFVLDGYKTLFNCGSVILAEDPRHPHRNQKTLTNKYTYRVYSAKDLVRKILPFFDKYPLILKNNQYRVWREAVMLIWNRQYHTHQGREKIASLKRTLKSYQSLKGKHEITTDQTKVISLTLPRFSQTHLIPMTDL